MRGHLTSRSVILRNASAQVLGFGASSLYMLVLVPVAVGSIGLEQFGLWTVMLAVTGYVGLIDAGLSTSFVKFVSEYASTDDNASINSVLFHGLLFYAVISLAALGIGALAGNPVLSLLDVPEEQRALGFLVLLGCLAGSALSSIIGVFGSLLGGLQRSDIANLHLTGTLLAKLAAIVLVLSAGLGLPGIVAADVGVTALSLLPMLWLSKRSFHALSFRNARYDRGMMLRLLRFGSKLHLSRFADIVQLQFDKLLLGRFLGLPSVSLYDFGARPLYRIRVLPLAPLSALLPAFSAFDAVDNTERMQAMYARAVRYLAIIAVPLFCAAFVLADEFLVAWLGQSQDGAALTLRILSVGLLLNVMTAVLSIAAQGKGRPEYQMQAMLVQALLNIILSVALVQAFGFHGAPLGTSIAASAGALLFMKLCGDTIIPGAFSTTIRSLVKPIGGVLAASAVSIPAHLWLWSFLDVGSRASSMLVLAVIFPLFVAVYTGSLVLFKGLTVEDVRFFRSSLAGSKSRDAADAGGDAGNG